MGSWSAALNRVGLNGCKLTLAGDGGSDKTRHTGLSTIIGDVIQNIVQLRQRKIERIQGNDAMKVTEFTDRHNDQSDLYM